MMKIELDASPDSSIVISIPKGKATIISLSNTLQDLGSNGPVM
jgi:hypothetical protein